MHHLRMDEISVQKYFNQRLLNQDNRFAKNLSYLFMAQYIVERNALESQISLSGTKGVVENPTESSKIVSLNDPFNVFQKIRGSPKYWQLIRNELFARVAQLGPFQIFFTLSCAEQCWSDMICNILKAEYKDLKIEYGNEDGWNGDDDLIKVNGEKLWDFVEQMPKSKYELMKDHIVLATRLFDRRVRSFVKNILMGPGEDKVEIEHYSYRVEFQARGMPHVHGVAWISQKYLEDKFDIKGLLQDNEAEKVTKLIDTITTCKIPKDDEKFAKLVKARQTHGHTDSCQKYGTKCRFDFPRLPSEYTIITTPISNHKDLKDEDQAAQLKKYEDLKTKAKSFVETLQSFDITWEHFYEALGTTFEEYHSCLTFTNEEVSSKIILKRGFDELFINNYNEEMLRAWGANMDLQIAQDPYAVMTYMTSYVTKEEAGKTQDLKDALDLYADKPLKEKLHALKFTYFTHRQIGASEAVYRIMPDMHLADSNCKVLFLPNGFPHKRSTSFRQTRKEDVDEDNLNDNEIIIEGRQGVYAQTISIIDRYRSRPKYLKNMVLVQFAYWYNPCTKLPKKVKMTKGGISEGKSDVSVIELKDGDKNDTKLPNYLDLTKSGLGFMQKRQKKAILRYHQPTKKDEHERIFTEMQLFSPWYNEDHLHPLSEIKCMKEFKKREELIQYIKDQLYPGENMIDLENIEIPKHIKDQLNNQGEQKNDDDEEEGSKDDETFSHMNWDGLFDSNVDGVYAGDYKYKITVMPRDEDLLALTRRLVPEQRLVLDNVIKWCKKILRHRKSLFKPVDPIRMIIHGGAGVGKSTLIQSINYWTNKFLTRDGDVPHQPRVLLCAPTGKAASLIDGITLHAAFNFDFGSSHLPLGDKKLSEFRENLKNLKMVIVDEISMVRLCKIM